MISPEWSLPPKTLTLGRDEVHVWRASLDGPEARAGELLAVLDPEERKRAERFRFRKDGERFVVARGTLRTLLGLYLDKRPSEVSLSYGSYGKPALGHESGAHPVRFNLSHSNALSLYAFAVGREVGIDVEYVRAGLASEEISERFFSAGEVAALRALDPGFKTEAFFNCWTRKEAYIKARGEGLSHPLHRFAVSMVPGEPAALLSADGDSEEVSRWSLRELKPAPGYAAALVVEEHGWRLKCYSAHTARPADPSCAVS